MKILITQRTLNIKKYKETRDSIDRRLIEWISNLSLTPVLVPNNLITKNKNYKNLKKFILEIKPKGIIFSGGESIGKYSLRDETEIYLIKYFIKKKYPIFGLCRGMQLISHYFGYSPIKYPGHVKTRHNLIVKKNIKNNFQEM